MGIKSKLKSTESSIRSSLYHRRHMAGAKRVLANIEEERGRLPSNIIKSCDEYSVDVLGGKVYSPWLYVYSAINGKFKEGWIPDNFYGAKVVPALKGAYGDISSLKALTPRLMNIENSNIVGSFINGMFWSSDFRIIDGNQVSDVLFSNCEKVVFKADSSNQGRGISFFTREKFSIESIIAQGNGVFEKYIEQHPFFNEFASGSVATLRITTAVGESGLPTARSSYLRFGSGSDTHVKSKSHIRVPIDLNNGEFSAEGYLPNWKRTAMHPTSNVIFSGKFVPEFKSCVDVVESLHRQIPFVRIIGWDVVVDKNGKVIIIEWNGSHNDIKFSEAVSGPCFKDLRLEQFR
ncbi:hypothetical protein KUW04_10930 [Halomonas denitrificans]|nr:hypothetical protein [Halomonas denitrificans]